jgi:hypothetical protein
MRRLLKVGILVLCCCSLWLTTGCELVDLAADGSATEGVVAESAAGGAGAEAALGEAEVGGPESMRGAEVVTPRAIALARESFGAEPVEGEVTHYDLNGKPIGRTILREGGAQNFDAYERKDGYSVRYQWGSRGWDRSGRYVGYTRVDGNISRGYDAEGRPDGLSQRVGDKAYAYDAQGRYTGYSVIRPLRTLSGPAVPIIPPAVANRCPQGTHLVQRRGQFYCTPNAVRYYSPYTPN